MPLTPILSWGKEETFISLFTQEVTRPRRTSARSFQPAPGGFIGLWADCESLCPRLPFSSVLPSAVFLVFQAIVVKFMGGSVSSGLVYVLLG